MRIGPLYEEFLSYLEVERDYSPHTICAYRYDGKLLLRALTELGIQPQIESITPQAVRQYITMLRQQGCKSASIARRLCSLRSFWRYLRDCEYTAQDPFLKISTPKKELRVPPYLSAQECAALLVAAERQGSVFLAFRDKAALATLIFSGVRRGELLNLRVRSVDLGDEKLVVEKGKGNKTRVLPLVPRLHQALADWLELRPACEHDFLFTTQWGARMSKRGLTSALRRALRGARITKPAITLHSLRHSFACLLLQNGCDLFSLSKMLGHTSLESTAIYLHVDMSSLQAAVAKHPRLLVAAPSQRHSTQSHRHRVDGQTSDNFERHHQKPRAAYRRRVNQP